MTISESPAPAPAPDDADSGDPAPRADPALDALGVDFTLAVAREWDRLHPDDLENLRLLAYALTAARRYEEALAADLRLVERHPERAEFHYDLACSYALLGRTEDAFLSLQCALARGFSDADVIRQDPDLASLHADPRWPAILARLSPP